MYALAATPPSRWLNFLVGYVVRATPCHSCQGGFSPLLLWGLNFLIISVPAILLGDHQFDAIADLIRIEKEKSEKAYFEKLLFQQSATAAGTAEPAVRLNI